MEQPRGTWPGFPRDEWPSIRWLTDPSDTLNDTNGPVVQVAPQVLDISRSLPKVDVELGSLVSSGEAVNGERDIGMYI